MPFILENFVQIIRFLFIIIAHKRGLFGIMTNCIVTPLVKEAGIAVAVTLLGTVHSITIFAYAF